MAEGEGAADVEEGGTGRGETNTGFEKPDFQKAAYQNNMWSKDVFLPTGSSNTGFSKNTSLVQRKPESQVSDTSPRSGKRPISGSLTQVFQPRAPKTLHTCIM